MLSHIWMKAGRKLPYEELQIKFDFRHAWLTFSWVIVFVQNSFSGLFFTLISHIRAKGSRKLPYEELHIKFDFCHGWPIFAWVIALFKLRFPDFSSLCFHISEWKLVGSFHMKSYRPSSTFAIVDLLFHELLPFVQNSFSRLFFTAFTYLIKVGRKLPYEELQIKFDFRHGWLTFSWVIAFVQNSFSGLFFTLFSHIRRKGSRKLPYEELQIKFDFRHSWPTFSWVIALYLKFFFRTCLHSAFTYQNESR